MDEGRIALVVLIGRSDEREVLLIGDDEEDALVFVLEDIAVAGDRRAWARRYGCPGPVGQARDCCLRMTDCGQRRRPRDRRHSPTRAPGRWSSAPSPHHAERRARARPARSAETQRVRGAMLAPSSAAAIAFSTTRRESSTQQSEYSNPSLNSGLSGSPIGSRVEINHARLRQFLAAADIVVEEKSEAQQPARPELLVIGQQEAQRPDDMGRDAP